MASAPKAQVLSPFNLTQRPVTNGFRIPLVWKKWLWARNICSGVPTEPRFPKVPFQGIWLENSILKEIFSQRLVLFRYQLSVLNRFLECFLLRIWKLLGLNQGSQIIVRWLQAEFEVYTNGLFSVGPSFSGLALPFPTFYAGV